MFVAEGFFRSIDRLKHERHKSSLQVCVSALSRGIVVPSTNTYWGRRDETRSGTAAIGGFGCKSGRRRTRFSGIQVGPQAMAGNAGGSLNCQNALGGNALICNPSGNRSLRFEPELSGQRRLPTRCLAGFKQHPGHPGWRRTTINQSRICFSAHPAD